MRVRQDAGRVRGTMQWRGRGDARRTSYRRDGAARYAALVGLALGLASPARAQVPSPRLAPVDVQVIVFSSGAGDEAQLSFTYRSPVTKGEPQRDLAAIARELRQPVPKAQVSTESIRTVVRSPRFTSVETRFRGLMDRAAGSVRVRPFARVFARFPHVRVTYFVDSGFRLKEPVENSLDAGVSATLSGQGPVFNVDLWRGPAAPRAAFPGRGRGAGTLAVIFVLLAAAAAGVTVYLVVRTWSAGRRPARRRPGLDRPTGEPRPADDRKSNGLRDASRVPASRRDVGRVPASRRDAGHSEPAKKGAEAAEKGAEADGSSRPAPGSEKADARR
jgi:hypothetical protein